MADEQGPIVVSVINMKGSVGKTTVAAMLARVSALVFKQDVLAIDLDPQANLSQSLMGEYGYKRFLENKSPSIVEIFKGYQPPTPLNPSSSPLDIDNVVHEVTSNLHVIPSRFDFSDNLISSIGTDPRVLARLIANSFQSKDLILIDCAPTESILTQTAYHASGYILVPVKPEFFATIGFPLLNDSLNAFKSSNPGHQIAVIGIVINNSFYDGGNDVGPEKERSMKEISEEASENSWHIFRNQLVHSRGFPKIMRGDFRYTGNALKSFQPFAGEFLLRLVESGWIPAEINKND
ncbi:MAG: ParA family protein [Chloroflexi bacterium]|nr:ParA family protein [Chloroflexota bacterium]